MVCDGNQDCADRSDERTCTMVMVAIENISLSLSRKYFSFSHQKIFQLPTQYKYNKAFPPSVKIKDHFGESFEKLVIPAEITIKDRLVHYNRSFPYTKAILLP